MTTLVSAHVGVYRLASRLLASEVDAPLFGRLREGGLLDGALAALPEREALDTLAAEFCRLVIGPDPVCLPYASVQRGEALLGSRTEQEITSFVRRHGLDVTLAPDVAVLSNDHLSVQLALLAHLDGTDAGAELVEQHMRPWAVTALATLADAAEWEPYRSVFATTAELLR